MIQSFANPEAEELFHGIHTHAIHKEIPQGILQAALRRLDILNAALELETFQTLPGMQGQAAVKDAHGKYSIPVEGDWRIAFRWNDGDAEEVELKR